jgi:Flp pilus assembly pilin Flp
MELAAPPPGLRRQAFVNPEDGNGPQGPHHRRTGGARDQGSDTMVDQPQRAHENGHDERGATAVEYGIIVAGIATVVIATVALLGVDVLSCFQSVEGAF